MSTPRVVSREEWVEARRSLLEREKAMTRLRDELSAERRTLPWVLIEKPYEFDTASGRQTLADLFEGRSQLIVYHFMFGPEWLEGCPGCSFLMDHADGTLPHLHARGITLTAASRAPLASIERFKRRMGWRFPWASSSPSEFNFDFHVSFSPEQMKAREVEYNFRRGPASMEELPGVSVFRRGDAGEVFHTYSAYARGLEPLVGTYDYIDLTSKGRDEAGLDSPMSWVRHHDRYGEALRVEPRASAAPLHQTPCPHCSSES
ncbi:MAG: DUF899 domain-containing protein [Phycisphaerales bacterium]|nr:DUF899 domain-containing protein [Phycisphaerales bacterium]